MSEINSKAAIGIHQSRYARDRRELISLMDRMRSAGVSSEIDIPRIAIIGESPSPLLLFKANTALPTIELTDAGFTPQVINLRERVRSSRQSQE